MIVKGKERSIIITFTVLISIIALSFHRARKNSTSDKKNLKGFINQLKWLSSILIPGILTKEFSLLVSLALLLIGKASLDVWWSYFNGLIVKAIVTKDVFSFTQRNWHTFGLMIFPITLINNLLKRVVESFYANTRLRLTNFAHKLYLSNKTFYRLSELDDRLQNPVSLIVGDLEKFASGFSRLESTFVKPLVDACFMFAALSSNLGVKAPLAMTMYYLGSSWFIARLSPDYPTLIAEEQKLESEFKFSHSKISSHNEDIAFIAGSADVEEKRLSNSLKRVVEASRKISNAKFMHGLADSLVGKYGVTLLANYLIASPLISSSDPLGSNIMEIYSRCAGLMVNLCNALGKISSSSQERLNFMSITSKVSTSLAILEEISSGSIKMNNAEGKMLNLNALNQTQTVDGYVEFRDVTIEAPDGEILVEKLDFRIDAGSNCMITGGSGFGKSAVFKLLFSLWPVYEGVVFSPLNIFYVPERSYLVQGSLRDQVTYPNMEGSQIDDQVVIRSLALSGFHDATTIDLDQPADLSGNDRQIRQKLGLARMFYNRPTFAVLDGGTKFLDEESEEAIYENAKALNITIFTVSDRETLIKRHEYVLKLDGEGGYEFFRVRPTSVSPKPAIIVDQATSSKGPFLVSSGNSPEPGILSIDPKLLKPEQNISITNVSETVYDDASENIMIETANNGDDGVTRISSKFINEIPLQPVNGSELSALKEQLQLQNQSNGSGEEEDDEEEGKSADSSILDD